MKDLMGRAIWDYYYQENPEDLQFLLIGPIWLLHFILKKIGIPY